MLKLSITLPNNAQINLETEDDVVIDRILGIVLTDVSRAILAGFSTGPTAANRQPPIERAAVVDPAPTSPSVTVETAQPVEASAPAEAIPASENPGASAAAEKIGPESNTGPAVEPNAPQTPEQAIAPLLSDWDASLEEPPPEPWPQLEGLGNGGQATNGSPPSAGNHLGMANLVPAVSEQAFVDFCRAANPLGDMRRVVVAAEGASRYLAIEGVDADALGRLFDIVGWPRAHNFVQTLRNAARSKFGWLERVPGRAGHYTVTDLGRATALGR
ncbi:MAG: hypothetical protein OXN21_04485 [Chloroflexota bacterium]|nr:hypothetical protein [Chloroflexota bacterium]